jgi:murein DD-endopeptidase MepM/ murein hydrolase activator NlpD
MRRLLAAAIPEWQVFIRRSNGSSEHFTITRKHQGITLAVLAAIAVWALVASMLLGQQPDELTAKERQLEEMMASTRTAQHRLASSQRLIGDMAREVDQVHANLLMLAESSVSLAKDGGRVAAPVRRSRIVDDASLNDDALPGGTEVKGVRDQVRRLEGSLDRLKATYAQVVAGIADTAGNRVADAERSLTRLGLNPEQLMQRIQRDAGRGGPFVPVPASMQEPGLSNLLSRMEQWATIKAVYAKLPLDEPLHQGFEVNSPFGARHDPLNHRTGIHEGVDLGAPFGTPVYATAEGVVEFAGPWDNYGLTIDIDHGNGVATRYAHLSRIKVKEGQRVTRSTVIGLLGNSGRSTGAHLHYEVRVADTPRDPLKFISVGRDAPKIR